MTKIKITENGLILLNQKIIDTEKLVKEIQAEKEIAYWGTGDGWHDNSIYNQLIGKEFMASKELNELLKKRDSAEIVKVETRNIQTVQIGSIVSLKQIFIKNNLTKNFVWEIVGNSESDPINSKIAYDTPLAKVIMGQKIGSKVSFTLPTGEVRIEILMLYENWESV